MRLVDKYTFNKEYLGKVAAGQVYYNVDATVSVFEGTKDDNRVLAWLNEKVEGLKEEGFSLTRENYSKILAMLDGKEPEVQDADVFEDVKGEVVQFESFKKSLLKELSEKQTVSSLQAIIKKLIESL